MVGAMPCACYSCPPCRVNRKRLWKSRIILESLRHAENAFITLTYDEEHVPKNGSLQPRDLQLFLKRFRRQLGKEIRFFAAGEYGSDTGQRPHYHLAVFGYRTCLNGRTDHLLQSCCSQCSLVKKAWGQGSVDLGEINEYSSAYIAKYVTKGWTKPDHVELKGRHPEFTRMSLRPGIGAGAMVPVGEAIRKVGIKRVLLTGDVPDSLRQAMQKLPLGRYLKRKLREQLGLPADTPEEAVEAYWKELLKLQKEARESSSDKARFSWKKYLLDTNKQKWLNLEARIKIHNK